MPWLLRKGSEVPDDKPKPTFDWDELDRILYERGLSWSYDDKPRRGFTVKTYAEQKGVSYDAAYGRIQKMLREGVIEQIGVLGPNKSKVFDIVRPKK